MLKRQAEVQVLRVEDMVISVPGRPRCYFNRLRYKGCPSFIKGTKEFKRSTELIDMKRDNFIRACYQLMSTKPNITTTQRFDGLVNYIRYLDDQTQVQGEDYLANDLIDSYFEWAFSQNALGKFRRSRISYVKRTLSWLLKQINREADAKKLPIVKGVNKEYNGAKALDLESELKPVVQALFRAYQGLLPHVDKGNLPERHPIYDEALVEKEIAKRGLKAQALSGHKGAFKKALNKVHPYNPIVTTAMMITFMFTGMNTTPLSNLRISDVSFREVQGGKYIFDSIKGRANYQEQDNALGFSKYAKEFIESWLVVAKKLAVGRSDGYLFPFFDKDRGCISYSESVKNPQTKLNKLLKRLGLPTISSSIFRKTKSDTIFRVTESVYLVAMTNNNSFETTRKVYIHGTEKEHENNLGAAMTATHALAKGQDVESAVASAKYQYGDILDNYDYQRLREGEDRTHEARTPTGVRCNDNTRGAAQVIKKSLKRAGIETDDNEVICTDFLVCFDCEHHALVTDVDDIWLMLSFKETLLQLQQIPAVNSIPEKKYTGLFNTVEVVLNGFREKNIANYQQAYEKLKESSHPLYATVYSLNDLLEIFR